MSESLSATSDVGPVVTRTIKWDGSDVVIKFTDEELRRLDVKIGDEILVTITKLSEKNSKKV